MDITRPVKIVTNDKVFLGVGWVDTELPGQLKLILLKYNSKLK